MIIFMPVVMQYCHVIVIIHMYRILISNEIYGTQNNRI
jgi:hypothetical protein